MRDKPWLISFLVAAGAVGASLWLWFGPWLWSGIPWLVAMGLPFLIALLAPKGALLLGPLPALVPYLLEGDVQPVLALGAVGASYVGTAFGILLRRMIGGGLS